MQGVNSSRIDEAAEWHVRQRAPLSAQDAAAFARWMTDSENRAAFEIVDGTWAELAGIPRPASTPPRRWAVGAMGGRRLAAAIAAALTLFVAGYSLDLPTRFGADGYTATGETRTMVLSDGSSVMLNTASAIAVDFSPGMRRVRLLRGEAVFTVAKDSSRPFAVTAAGGEVRALGTAFAVRHDAVGAMVAVIESRVGVSYPAGALSTVALGPGEAVNYSQSGVGAVRTIDIDTEMAWRRGKLIFVDRPLGSVVGELNRYHSGLIQITDSSISQHLVSGVFDTTDPVRALDAIQSSLGLHSTRLTKYLILLHR